MAEILNKEESYSIIVSYMAVHKKLGSGFLESVYSEALEKQFTLDNIPFVKENKLRIQFDDSFLDKFFTVDFVCFDEIIAEIKATPFIHTIDVNQILNYLKATALKLGTPLPTGRKQHFFRAFNNQLSPYEQVI